MGSETAPAAPSAPAEASPAPVETPTPVASGQEAAPPPPIVTESAPKLSAFERAQVLHAKALEALKTGAPKDAVDPHGQVPAPKAESPAEPPKTAPSILPETKEPPADPFSKQFQALAVQQAELRREKQALAAERGQGRDAFMLEMRELARKDPGAVLERTGLNYQQLTDFYLEGKLKGAQPEARGGVDPEVAAQLKELRDWKASQESRAATEKAESQATAFRSNVLEKAKAGGEKYELVAAYGPKAAQRVLDVLEEHHRATGEIPGGSIEAAIELGLAHIEKQLEAESLPLLSTRKLKSRLAPAGTPLEAPRPNAETGQTAPRTLTNSLAGAAPPKPSQRKSRDELHADALRVLTKGSAGS